MTNTKLPLLMFLFLFLNNRHATNASSSSSLHHAHVLHQQQRQQLPPTASSASASASASAAAATAFFSPISKRRAPIPLSEEMGTSPALSYTYFDPFNLATEDNFAILREAELKHGRIAMLATIGNVLPDIVRVVGADGTDNFLSSIFSGASNNINMNNPHPQTFPYDILHSFQDIPCGIKALFTIPFLGWLQIFFFIGILETKVIVQKSPTDMPGDYGTGYFGVRDKARNERSLRSELENGRLAMVAFLGQVVAELVSGDTALEQIRHTLEKQL